MVGCMKTQSHWNTLAMGGEGVVFQLIYYPIADRVCRVMHYEIITIQVILAV